MEKNMEKEKNIYSNGKLIFDAVQKIGKRNGEGKQYFDGKLIFDCNFLNGQKHGIGKEYNMNGEISFEGEFLQGKRWNGKGKIYDILGVLRFEGTHLNGKRKE